MKLLLVYTGADYYIKMFANELIKNGFDVDICNIYGSSIDVNLYENISYDRVKEIEVANLIINNYDIVFGIDNRCIPFLNDVANLGIKTAIQILDYPAHCFMNNKDYVPGLKEKWEEYKILIKNIDYIIHNQFTGMHMLNGLYKDTAKVAKVIYPVSPRFVSPYKTDTQYIVYSGRISADKGVHYLISALGLITNIKLITIGYGTDMAEFAKYMNVKYEHYNLIKEDLKWQIYHGASLFVSCADNDFIPALFGLEAISIGKPLIAYDSIENRLRYREYAEYCNVRNAEELANKILYNINTKSDIINKNAISYCESECSFKKWALDIRNLFNA